MENTRKVPSLSLLSFVHGGATEKARFVDEVFRGLKDYGFIVLNDHTVDEKITKRAYDVVHEFFQLQAEVKQKYICKDGGGQRGYTAFGIEHAKNSPYPDLKEFWHVGREVPVGHKYKAFYHDNIWPTEIPEFKDTLTNLYNSLNVTAELMLEAIGIALDVPQHYFRDMIRDGNSILRPIHYPSIDERAPKNAVRSAAHEDINLITVMVGATTSGLELLDRDGKWLPVKNNEKQLVVDTGDMLSRLTNDILPATTHRVVNPDNSNSTRYSMPFFVHPNPETNLACLPSCVGAGEKYPAINSHEFLMQRLHEIGLMKN